MVVTGGTNVFAAGADLKETADASSVDMLLHHNPAPLWDRLRRLTKPLIAAAAGYALAG
jgi:enoyl-CoA hydratase